MNKDSHIRNIFAFDFRNDTYKLFATITIHSEYANGNAVWKSTACCIKQN